NIDCYGYKNDLKLTSINAADAYLEGALGQGVTVGVADTGMDVSNPRLSASIVPGRDFTDPSRTAEMTDPGGHGTLVGGVIAGDASQNHYGIAPQAKLMPLKIANEDGDFTGSTTEAIEYAVAQGIQVVNHSYGIVGRLRGTYTGEMTVYADAEEDENGEIARRNTIVVTVKNAEFAARVPPHVAGYGAFRFSAGKIRNIIRDKDIIMVWSAGNDGWNAETGRISVCANLTVSFRKCSKDDAGAILRDDFIRGFTKQDGSALSDVEEIYRSYTGAYGMHPIYASDSRATEDKIFDGKTIADFEAIMEEDAGFAEIASRWVVVTALDKKGKIVNFSNGCGPSKFWCISALGVGVETTRAGGGRAAPDGTSFSAPIVSGALAVVKSRFTELPMPVVRAILLSTATPMGARAETGELDEVYGWGKVNLSSAVHFSTGNLSMVVAPGTGEDEDGEDSGGGTDCDITDENSSGCSAAVSADIPLSQARINLPAALAHLKPQMESAQAAVSFNGDAYFNMPLSGIAKIAAAPETELGGAAAELLHPAEDEYFNESVFFAAKDTRTNRFRHAGAAFSSQKFGDWSAQYDFCEDCKKSAWQEWKIFANNENGIENETANTGEEITAPFFAHNEKSFALQMKGEGLRPFASFGEANGMPYEQYGLRLRQNYARFGWLAETSQTNESESFLGANFGAFGKTSSKTTEGKIALHGDLAKNWRGFAEYSRAKSKVQTAGILSAVDGLQAQGWSAGMEWQNIFSGGDRIRFTARQKMSINGGRAILRYSEAEGDFTRAFYGNLPGAESQDAEQELKERTLQLDLSEKANPSIAIGYAAEMQGAEFAIGAEYGNNGKKAISAQFRIDW
ncbi:MAG: S8 family peptidase, partial [Gammaproteobacteria bacterium]